MNALIVDDDTAQLEGTGAIITTHFKDTRCLKASSYNEAVDILNGNMDIDIILLDIDLNSADGHNGIDLGRYIRSLSPYKHTPILFITGYVNEAARAIHATNCFDFIEKPLNSTDLIDSVQKLINMNIISEKPIRFRDVSGVYFRLLPSEIVYLKAVHRNAHVYTVLGEFVSSSTPLKDIIQFLPKSFIRCHKSYIVNTHFISACDRTNLLIKLRGYEHVPIPIGRTYQATVYQQLDNQSG